VLSQRGQTLIATKSELFSIRDDVEGEFTSSALRKILGASIKTIGVGPGLMVYLDQSKRLEFIKLWRQATSRPP
jgi:iron(III) transport system substrate-binding protein